MLRWALFFFLVALVASLFGFGGFAAFSADIGKTLLGVFVVLVLLAIALGGWGYNRFFGSR